jgi:transposase
VSRIEILTGRERRRRWSVEEKLDILEEASRPGISAAAVARRHDILPQQLYAWRRRYRRRSRTVEDTVSFLPVEMVADGSVAAEAPTKPRRTCCGGPIEISCRNGRVLKVACGMDADTLRTLIRVVEAA